MALLAGSRQPCLPSCSHAPALAPATRPLVLRQRNGCRTQSRSTVCQSLPFDATAPQGHVLSRSAGSRLRRVLKNTRQRIKDTQSALAAVALQLSTGGAAGQQALETVPGALESELRLLTERLKQLASSPELLNSGTTGGSSSGTNSSLTATATTFLRPLPAPAPVLEPAAQPAGVQPLPPNAQGRVLVCQGSKCQAAGAMNTLRTASTLAAGCPGVEVLPSKCLGKCKMCPVVRVKGPEPLPASAAATAAGEQVVAKLRGAERLGHLYTQVSAETLAQAMHQHCTAAPSTPLQQL